MTEQSSETLEEQVKKQAERAVLKFVSEPANWIAPDYKNRLRVPQEFMTQAWSLVDTQKIQKQLARRIEEELADRIMNHIASEMATDVKSILSVQERREALRAIAREHVDEVCRLGREDT